MSRTVVLDTDIPTEIFFGFISQEWKKTKITKMLFYTPWHMSNDTRSAIHHLVGLGRLYDSLSCNIDARRVDGREGERVCVMHMHTVWQLGPAVVL